jgi:glutathionyl-hydroquinone reductase
MVTLVYKRVMIINFLIWQAPQSNLGAYVRPAAQFSVSKQTALSSEGRYHLYVGNPCTSLSFSTLPIIFNFSFIIDLVLLIL